MRLILYFILIAIGPAFGQLKNNHFIERITLKDGLISPFINSIFEDKAGFVWIGTSEGLQRFDGQSFKNYFATRTNPSASILFPNVMDINQDPQGKIWIGTKEGGISVFLPEDDQFTHFNSKNDKQFTVGNDNVWWNSSVIDNEGNIWYGTSGGLVFFDTHTLRHEVFRSDNSNLIYNEVSVVLKSDQKNRLWVAGADGISLFDYKKKVFYHRLYNPEKLKVFDTKIYVPSLITVGVAMLNIHLSNNKLWIATHDSGNWVYDVGQNTLEKINLSLDKSHKQPLIYCFLQRKEAMLMATTQGLIEYNIEQKKITSVQQNAIENPNSLPNSGLKQIVLDRQQNYWIATQNGIGRYKSAEDRFSFIQLPNYDNPNDPHVFTACATQLSDGTIMAGTAKGIYALDAQLNLLQFYKFKQNKAFSTEYVFEVIKTAEGNMMAVTNEGILFYDHKTKTFDDFGDIPGLQLRFFISCFQESEHIFWFGAGIWNNALLRLDTKARTLEPAYFTPNRLDRNKAIRVWRGADKKLNVLNDKGVYVFDVQKRVFEKSVVLDPTQPKELYLDLKPIGNKYYVTLTNGGFGIYDPVTKKIERYSRQNGLLGDAVTGFEIDNQGFLWVLTTNGLSRFNPKDKIFLNFSEKDGLRGINFKAITKLQTGELLVGNQMYLIKINPEKISKNVPMPSPVFTACRVGDTELALGALKKRVVVAYNKNFFSVNYASLFYANAAGLKYAYQMVGYDTDWQVVNNKTSAIYTNLDGGEYEFRVKVANTDGSWNEQPATIQIFVTTPYYRTWWFFGLCFMGVLGLLYGLYRYRLAQILKLHTLRNNISRDLHDEVGSSLSSISMLSTSTQIALEKDPERGKMLVAMISKNAQKILEDMDDIVWAVSPNKDSFQHVVARIQDYLNTIEESKKITIDFEQTGHFEKLNLPMLSRRNLYLIFKEAVNNAAKHAEATKISVKLSLKNTDFELTIADDGIGFDITKTNSRNGLGNMQSRAKEIDGKLSITSNEKGTRIALSVPL